MQGPPLLSLLLMGCVLVSTEASGAMQFSLVPSVALSTIHDDNVLLQQDAQSDIVTRASPSILVAGKSRRTSLVGSYSFDAEHYRRHTELDSGQSQYTGDFKLTFDATRRLQLGTHVLREMTQTAGELNPGTGLQPGRIEGRRTSFTPYARYQLGPDWRLRAGFTQTRDELAGSPNVRTRNTSVSATRALSKDDSIGIDYHHFGYRFGSTQDENANLVMLQWRHAFSDRLNMNLAVGPRRSSAAGTRVNATGSLRYRLARGVIHAEVSRQQNTLLGQVGTVTVKSVSMGMGYMLTRGLGISIDGGYSDMNSDTFSARSDEASVQAWYRLSSVISLVAGYSYFGQRGDALVPRLHHRTVTLTLVLGWPAPATSPQLEPDRRYLSSSLVAARKLSRPRTGSQMDGVM